MVDGVSARIYQGLLSLSVVAIGAAFLIGKEHGRREVPRVGTDRQAATRWMSKCRDRGGMPGVSFGVFLGVLQPEPACRLTDPNDRIEVE